MSTSEVTKDVQDKIREVMSYIDAFGAKVGKKKHEHGLVPAVFMQKFSETEYSIGWFWAKEGAEVGTITIDDTSRYPRKKIMWVYLPCETCDGTGMVSYTENQSPLGSGMAWFQDFTDPCGKCLEDGHCPQCRGQWTEAQRDLEAGGLGEKFDCPLCGFGIEY